MTIQRENLGPADRILRALINYSDHLYHHRTGIISKDTTNPCGVSWAPASYKEIEGRKAVFRLPTTKGKGQRRVQVGTLNDQGLVLDGNGRQVGEFRSAGIQPEVALWMYRQVAEVYKLDHEFCARWASYAFTDSHRDAKVVLAAFMLVQARKGDPVVDGGEVLFFDEDFRDVGEAMILSTDKNHYMNPKMLLRIHEVLSVPGIAELNHELGFGTSTRHAFMGRYKTAITKWLAYREQNEFLLRGLVKNGFRNSIIRLAQIVGYKPTSSKFFWILRWKQVQAKDGRREVGLTLKFAKAEDWSKLSERQICNRIMKDKPSWKVIAGRIPELTRAIMVASIEAGSLSDKDLIMFTSTLEDLGLLGTGPIRTRWERALQEAEDARARNVAKNVKSKDLKEKLEDTADKAVQKEIEKATRNLRVYISVDISGSMENALEAAKPMISQIVQAIPSDRLHVAVFNTIAREIKIPHASTKGVDAAFRGVRPGGGTRHGSIMSVFGRQPPKDDEDAVFLFVGDEGEWAMAGNDSLSTAIREAGWSPVGFGMFHVGSHGDLVHQSATALGIPCFDVGKETFSDVYAIPRILRNLLESTPVSKSGQGRKAPARESLIDKIIQFPILQKPAWAA